METDPFRIRNHVADFDDIVRDIVERSERTRRSLPMMGDVAYGDGPAESIDIFFPSGPRKNLPVHMFIHGGYWRMFSKRDYSYIADTVTQAGAIAVIVDYVRRAKRWVLGHIAELGGEPSSLTVSGHSAGAHLATFLFTREPEPSNLKSALLLGGLYDLAPLQQSFLQHEIGLTEQEVSRFTPLSQRHDRACRVTLAVGERETRPFHSQLDAFKIHLRDESVPVSVRVLSGRNHMDSVRDLGIPGTEAGELLSALVSGRP